MRWNLLVSRLAVLAAMFVVCAATMAQQRSTLRVDARDIERRLITVQQDIPVEPGETALHYVLWTPGNHSPSGPIQNVVDLKITDDRGRDVSWRRDVELPTMLRLTVAEGARVLTVRFAYITNQPSVISRSTDSYGYAGLGALNWNTVLLYPDGVDKDEWMIEAELRLPGAWRSATPLEAQRSGAGRVQYFAAPLSELVDSPVIFGASMRTYELETRSRAPHFIHAVAPTVAMTDLGAERLEKFGRMIDQAEAVFGLFPRDEYHFLVLLSDEAPGLGVEHNESTFITLRESRFNNAERSGDHIGVIAHEYIHAWSGKLRAPEGLLSRDYHTTGDPRLLWLYEGLTSYYDDVLSVRAGLLTPERYRASLAGRVADNTMRDGRAWQSVEDTAVMLRHVRGGSASWGDKRRGQAYYGEGAFFWMEADAIIRRGTNGERSLDDFCRMFFDVPAGAPGSPVTYTRRDVVHSLAAVYDGHDWDALIRARIETPGVDMDRAAMLERLGLRMIYTESGGAGGNLTHSIGLSADSTGEIMRVVPGSAADAARLGQGMKILAVNDAVYSPDVLRDAVARTPERRMLSLLIAFGGEVRTVRVQTDAGLRSATLQPIPGAPDVLGEILLPR